MSPKKSTGYSRENDISTRIQTALLGTNNRVTTVRKYNIHRRLRTNPICSQKLPKSSPHGQKMNCQQRIAASTPTKETKPTNDYQRRTRWEMTTKGRKKNKRKCLMATMTILRLLNRPKDTKKCFFKDEVALLMNSREKT